MFTVRRQGEINRPGAAGGDLIERGQLAVLLNAPRLHHAFLHFAGGIQRFAIARDGQLRDVRQRAHQRLIAQRAGLASTVKRYRPSPLGL
jgi:hypothetical protein